MSYCIFPLTREMNLFTADELEKKMLEGGCNNLSPDGRYFCNFPCTEEGVHRAMSEDGHEIAEWIEKDMTNPVVFWLYKDGEFEKEARPKEASFPKQSQKGFKHETVKDCMLFVLKAGGMQPVRNRRKGHSGMPARRSTAATKVWIAKRYGIQLCGGCQKAEPCRICYTCVTCNTKRSPSLHGDKCTGCNSCKSCCTCFTCSHCGRKKPVRERHFNATTQRGCQRCNSCCECGISVPYTTVVTNFNHEPSVRYPRYMGVEIECGIKPVRRGDAVTYETLQDVTRLHGAGIGSDGSVGVPDCNSVEIVTSPSRGEDFVTQVTQICDTLKLFEAKVNKSCGLHVHVDMRRVAGSKTLAIIRLYTRVERALFSIVSFSRRNPDGASKATLIKYKRQGGYAGPWADRFKLAGVLNDEVTVESRLKALDLMIYGTEATAASYKSSHGKHVSRYHGLNVQALHVHNTLEFRLHQGTVNAYKILMWAGVCSAIVEYGLHHTEEEIKAMKGSSAQILEQILFPDQELITWCRARRAYFIEKERKRRGLASWGLTAKVPASPGPVEESETSGPDRVRVAFRREQERLAAQQLQQAARPSIFSDEVSGWTAAPSPSSTPRRR